MKIKYNQGLADGGGAPAPASGSPAPASAAPAASSSGSPSQDPQVRFASDLRQALTRNTASPSQPPSNGNKTPAQAGAGEGDASGAQVGDQSTTANGEDLTNPEGKGADNGWSPDDLTFLKAQGMESLPFSPEVGKIVKSGRELRSEFDRVSQSNTNAITTAESQRQAAYAAANGDLETFQKVFGVDLQVERRTPETRIAEIEKDAKEYQDAMQSVLTQLEQAGDAAGAQAVIKAWDVLAGKLDGRAKVIKDEQSWLSRKNEWLKEAGKAPDKADAYTSLMGKAKEHLAILTTEDKDAPLYFKAIEQETKPGGALAALDIDLAKAYGRSPATARFVNKIGKALTTLQQMPQILAAERKRAEADFERKQSQGGPRGSSTGGSVRGGGNQNPVIANLQSAFSSVGKR